jgi:uncharacterized protein YecT (DUF1311 family)
VRTPVILALLFALASPASAAGVCAASGACDNAGSNLEYKHCLYLLAQKQDKALNILYKKVLKSLKAIDNGQPAAPKAAPLFVAAQQKWIAFRTKNCAAEFNVAGGGTAGGGFQSNCQCNLTYHRNRDLKRMLSDY